MSDVMVGARYITASFYNGSFGLEVATSVSKFWIKFGENPLGLVLFMQANDVKHFYFHPTIAGDAERYEAFTVAAKSIGYEV